MFEEEWIDEVEELEEEIEEYMDYFYDDEWGEE